MFNLPFVQEVLEYGGGILVLHPWTCTTADGRTKVPLSAHELESHTTGWYCNTVKTSIAAYCSQVRCSPSSVFCLQLWHWPHPPQWVNVTKTASWFTLLFPTEQQSRGLVSCRLPLVQLISLISTLGFAMTLNKFHNQFHTLWKWSSFLVYFASFSWKKWRTIMANAKWAALAPDSPVYSDSRFKGLIKKLSETNGNPSRAALSKTHGRTALLESHRNIILFIPLLQND